MLLTQNEFDRALERQQLHLALVGMSNSGKSTCSGLLTTQAGFKSFEVDQAINQQLNIDSMELAARWMGYPYEEKYAANRSRYLELEEQLTRIDPPNGNFVLDTTGSIIHCSEDLKSWIRKNFLVIGLHVHDDLLQTMVSDYFARPKTVIWGDEYRPFPEETPEESLKRCYPRLLNNRASRYQELADVEVSATLARSPELTAQQLLAEIRSALPGSSE